ncbi:MAG: glycosyltransferase [Bacteroidia bacterium]|nr:glycosyltransferase [Bacteroidia bacterium]
MNTARKVLYLTYDGLSDPLGQSQILPYLSGLRKLGHQITILSSEKKGQEILSGSIKNTLSSLGIEWIFIHYTKSPPILSTLFDIIRMYRICIRVLKKGQFDTIHCRSYITALIGIHLKKKFHLSFVFDTRGFYADERIDGDMWNQRSFIYRIIYRYFKMREARFMQYANYTICLTEAAREEIHSWKSIPGQPIPIKVIPCCADTTLFHSESINDAEKKLWSDAVGISGNNLVISYAGAVGTWYMLDEMLDFYKRLLIKFPEARFLFITHESAQFILSKVYKRGIPASQVIIRKAHYKDVPVLLSLSQIALFFIKPVYSKKASSPTKLGEIMSMGIPIICNSNVGDTDRIIREVNAGAIVRTFSNEDYDFIIDQIPDLLKLSSRRIRAAAIEHFSLKNGIERYHEVYSSLP